VLHRASGDFVEMPGWDEDITDCRTEDDLPQAARDYLEFVEEFVGVPVALISVGPGRDQVIWTESGKRTAPALRLQVA
jgi:adenylosuccinate synthase